MIKKILLLIFFVTLTTFLLAQTAIIRGFVYNEKNEEPIEFCSVIIKGSSKGSSTSQDGFYNITGLSKGKYTLVISYLGFEKKEVLVEITNNKQIVNRKIKLTQNSKKLKAININSKRRENKNKVKISVQKFTPKEIKSLPSIGGEPDLAQYLQVLPGVVFSGSQGGQLYIRGGSPVQNKILLDGMVIYNPFHFIGLFSVFDTEILKSVDVYTGGFNAQYGGRISSIMDLKTKDGNNQQMNGKISLSSFNSKIQIEGPLKRPKKNSSSISYLLSLKRSHINEISSIYKPYFKAIGSENTKQIAKDGLPYNFLDIYGKLKVKTPSGSSFSLSGFNFSDKVNYTNSVDLNWKSYGGSANFLLVPPTSKAIIKGLVSYSEYRINQNDESGLPKTSGINGFNVNMEMVKPSENFESRYGFDIEGLTTDLKFYNASKQVIKQVNNNTQLSGYIKYRWKLKKLIISPGLRLQYYASLAELSPEPRLAFKYNLGKNDQLRLKFSGGLYSQNIIASNSEQDIVNLFYGFISGPQNVSKSIKTEDGSTKTTTSKLQKAYHLIGGFEYDLPKNIDINVEVYFKRFTQLIELNNNKKFPDSPLYIDLPDIDKKDFIPRTGNAYGLDITISHKKENQSIWVVYSLGKVDRWDGSKTYYASFDRRHNINLLYTYDFGKNKDWSLSARWNFGTGFPFTQNQGNFEKITIGSVNQDINKTNGTVSNTLASINGGRLPTYHRLDFSVKKHFLISDRIELEGNFSISNLYNRANIFTVNTTTKKISYQLPIIPSLGLTLSF